MNVLECYMLVEYCINLIVKLEGFWSNQEGFIKIGI